MEAIRVQVADKQDRDQMVMILCRNGYVVLQGKEKQGNKTVCFVEYWRPQ